MEEFTRIINSVRDGEVVPADELLPIVYEELRRMAAGKMAGEAGGHTLQATALVHEAWMRLSKPGQADWENRAHFFGSAAEAMRRILVDHARKKLAAKRGGGVVHVEFDESSIQLAVPADELLAVHEALDGLAREDGRAAELVKLRYFVGLTMAEAAIAMGMGKRSAENLWTFAKVWLHREIKGGQD
ncbi:MAG: RNA polymerase sigma factor (TIGR02999 family) [Verrucomicrobiales bacterium]